MSAVLGPRQQSGVVLIVSLVLLLMMTIIGVGAMRSTGLQMKMAQNVHDRQQNYEEAIMGLLAAEQRLNEKAISQNDFFDIFKEVANQVEDSDGTEFKSRCFGGLCFDGEYVEGTGECLAINADPPLWRQPESWRRDTDPLHFYTVQDLEIPGRLDAPKYIIEFLCQIPDGGIDRNSAIQLQAGYQSNYTSVLRKAYRVTGHGSSEFGGTVMVQSTFIAP